jgi:hypothetical protein
MLDSTLLTRRSRTLAAAETRHLNVAAMHSALDHRRGWLLPKGRPLKVRATCKSRPRLIEAFYTDYQFTFAHVAAHRANPVACFANHSWVNQRVL